MMRLTFQRYPTYVAMWEKLWSCFGYYTPTPTPTPSYTNTINKICPCDQREDEAGSKSQSLWWIKTICDLHLEISNVIRNQKKLALVSGCQRWDKAGSYISATLPHLYLCHTYISHCHTFISHCHTNISATTGTSHTSVARALLNTFLCASCIYALR